MSDVTPFPQRPAAVEKDQCSNCLFFMRREPSLMCRRYPPTTFMVGTHQAIGQPTGILTQGFWTPINEDDWCGEHQRKMALAEQAVDLGIAGGPPNGDGLTGLLPFDQSQEGV